MVLVRSKLLRMMLNLMNIDEYFPTFFANKFVWQINQVNNLLNKKMLLLIKWFSSQNTVPFVCFHTSFVLHSFGGRSGVCCSHLCTGCAQIHHGTTIIIVQFLGRTIVGCSLFVSFLASKTSARGKTRKTRSQCTFPKRQKN